MHSGDPGWSDFSHPHLYCGRCVDSGNDWSFHHDSAGSALPSQAQGKKIQHHWSLQVSYNTFFSPLVCGQQLTDGLMWITMLTYYAYTMSNLPHTPHSPSSRSSRTQPLLSSLSLSTSIQQTAGSEREDAVDQPALSDYTVTTHQTVMNRTAAVASAYELPVTSVRQCIEGLQNNTMDNRVLTLPPRSAIRRSTVKQQSDFKQI